MVLCVCQGVYVCVSIYVNVYLLRYILTFVFNQYILIMQTVVEIGTKYLPVLYYYLCRKWL